MIYHQAAKVGTSGGILLTIPTGGAQVMVHWCSVSWLNGATPSTVARINGTLMSVGTLETDFVFASKVSNAIATTGYDTVEFHPPAPVALGNKTTCSIRGDINQTATTMWIVAAISYETIGRT